MFKYYIEKRGIEFSWSGSNLLFYGKDNFCRLSIVHISGFEAHRIWSCLRFRVTPAPILSRFISLRPEQRVIPCCRLYIEMHFPEWIFQILIEMSLKCAHKRPRRLLFNNRFVLSGKKPSAEPWMINIYVTTCVTYPKWIMIFYIFYAEKTSMTALRSAVLYKLSISPKYNNPTIGKHHIMSIYKTGNLATHSPVTYCSFQYTQQILEENQNII